MKYGALSDGEAQAIIESAKRPIDQDSLYLQLQERLAEKERELERAKARIAVLEAEVYQLKGGTKTFEQLLNDDTTRHPPEAFDRVLRTEGE